MEEHRAQLRRGQRQRRKVRMKRNGAARVRQRRLVNLLRTNHSGLVDPEPILTAIPMRSTLERSGVQGDR
eukprot:3248477-Heterocapsa_arctica.AAC.1